MARVKENIFGGVSGRIGNVVSCQRYGKYYLRTLPAEVKHPDTERQLAQRMRFALIQELQQSIRKFLRVGFGAWADGRSAYNAAMSHNLKNALTGVYPDIRIDFPKVQVSKGTLAPAEITALQQNASGSITINWQNNPSDRNSNASDRVLVLLLATEPYSSSTLYLNDLRLSGQATFPLSDALKNRSIHVYLSFFAEDIFAGNIQPKHISDSVYCGEVVANN